MRYVYFLLIITACRGLTKSDREYISLQIENHNVKARVNYYTDLFEEKNRLIMQYGSVPAEQLDRFKANWNNPYRTGRDTSLTFEKFMAVCKEVGLDPRKYVDDLPDR